MAPIFLSKVSKRTTLICHHFENNLIHEIKMFIWTNLWDKEKATAFLPQLSVGNLIHKEEI